MNRHSCYHCKTFRVGGGYITKGYGTTCSDCGNHIDISLGEHEGTHIVDAFEERGGADDGVVNVEDEKLDATVRQTLSLRRNHPLVYY